LDTETTSHLSEDTWYNIQIDWQNDNTINVKIIENVSTYPLRASLSATDNNYSEGGIGFGYDNQDADKKDPSSSVFSPYYDFSEIGNPNGRSSPNSKYIYGYDMDGVDDKLQTDYDSDHKFTGDKAFVIAFEIDNLPSSSVRARLFELDANSGGKYAVLDVNPDGTIFYNDGASGPVESNNSINAGNAYQAIVQVINGDLTVEVYDASGSKVASITESNRGTVNDQGDGSFTVGADYNNDDFGLDGGVYEYRVWKFGDIPTISNMQAWADPNDSAWEDTAEGNEHGLWYLYAGGGKSEALWDYAFID